MFGFIGNIGPWELVLILIIALVVVGPGKLPEVAKSLGKAAREFKKATTGIQKEFHEVMRVDDEVKVKDNKKDAEKPKATPQETVTELENENNEEK